MIDVKTIPELVEIIYNPASGLTLGAAVSCQRVYEHPDLVSAYPGLIDAAELIGGVQIQNRASFGGNLCNSSPAADSIPAMIVHYATCRIAGPDGTREVPVEQFCTAPGNSADRKTFARARIALGAVAPTPLLVEAAGELVGQSVTDEAISKVALAAQAAARPITDMRGTAEYRRHLVGVLTRRALRKAIERA
jgi:carbon-monoxide dehydrogenase medium subunit